jgi:hypothetical protein
VGIVTALTLAVDAAVVVLVVALVLSIPRSRR